MKRTGLSIVVIIGLCLLWVGPASAGDPNDHVITYQGRLMNADQPVNDTADFEFMLYDAETGGMLVGMYKQFMVPVEDGLFTVDLNFGEGVFTGEPRWLEISFWLKSGGDYQTLSPRQAVRPAPYALYAFDGAGGGGESLWQEYGDGIWFGNNVGIGEQPSGSQQLRVIPGSGEYGIYVNAGYDSNGYAVIGISETAGGYGLFGRAEYSSGVNYGVYGETLSSTGYAGYFVGQGYFSGNLGLGVSNPAQKLDIAGTAKMTGFQMPTGAQNGYVLTTDPNGVATWQPGGGSGSSPWISGTNLIYYNGGNVGIGVSSPESALHVIDDEPNSPIVTFEATGMGGIGLDASSAGGNGMGVSAWASGYGGTAVSGKATGNANTAIYGRGMGTSELNYGARLYSEGDQAIGVYAEATRTGATAGNYGGYFLAAGDRARGVYGIASSTTGINYGVSGRSYSTAGRGIYGYASAGSGNATGVMGETGSPDGYGVCGYNDDDGSSGDAIGVYGSTNSPAGIGVKGHADAPDGYGVFGSNTATTGSAVGVYGQTGTASGFGGYFVGRGYFSNNVGIGIASPASKLGVAGVIESLSGGFKFPDGTIQTTAASGGGGESLWETDGYDIWYTSGNIGAGVSNPQSTLHVAGGNWDLANTEGDFKIGNSTYRLKMGVATDGGGAGHCRIFAGGPASKLTLGANGGDMLTVTGTDVGIGTLYPSQELDVVGTARMDGFQLDSSATSGYVLTCDSYGNGSWQEATGGGDFNLPYEGTVSSSSPAFRVTNSGTGISSHAISARIDNASSHGDACAGYFSASGSNGYAIYATADGTSVRSYCSSSSGTAVSGSSAGYGGYFSGSGTDCYGVKGTAGAMSGTDTVGGWFESNSSNGKGVYAYVDGDYATAVKAIAEGGEGNAIHAEAPWNAIYAKGGLNAAKLYGDVRVYEYGTSNLVFHVDGSEGTTSVDVLRIMGGSDLAENFDVTEQDVQPGTVVEIDPDNPGKLRIARGAYNRRVAGVTSGANGVNVGMVLADLPGSENSMPIALSGRVWVRCDASLKAVEPGDLLTTAERPGYAMSVLNYDRAHGAVIGKAMSTLSQGETGMVLVLVNLQ